MNILRLVASSAGSAETSHSISRHAAFESKAGIFDSVKIFIRARIEKYKAQAKERKDTEHVLQMNDQMLKDIGLAHSDRNSLEAGQTSLKELNDQHESYFSPSY